MFSLLSRNNKQTIKQRTQLQYLLKTTIYPRKQEEMYKVKWTRKKILFNENSRDSLFSPFKTPTKGYSLAKGKWVKRGNL